MRWSIAHGCIALMFVAIAGGSGAADPFKTGPSVRALVVSPDDRYLVATSGEPEGAGHATVWELSTGKVCFSCKEPKGIPAAALSPDGKRLVLGSFTENALVIETAKWSIERQLPGHGKAARGVAFADDGKMLAVGSYDGFVRLWDVPSWTERKTIDNAHAGWVYAVAFSKDGKTLATCGADNTAKLWSLESGLCLHTFKHESIIRRVVFTPDDRHIVYTSWDGTLAIRSRATGRWVMDFDRYGSGDDVAVTRDGKLLAVVSGDVKVVPIDLRSADDATAKRIQQLMTAWDDDAIAVRDRASRDIAAIGIPALGLLRQAAKDAASPEVRLRARLVRSVIQSCEPRHRLRHPEGDVQSLAFSGDGQTLATGGADGIVRLWNVADGKETRLLRQFPPTPPRVPRSKY
jgi:WD40 repeat protein